MTTTREVLKLASRSFTPEMAKRGFSLAKRMPFYWRKVNDIYHCVVLGFNRGNEKMFLQVFAWVPELALQPFDWERFPDEVTMVTGGELAESGPVQRAAGVKQWTIGTDEECMRALDAALVLIDAAARPWFANINSREDMVRHIRPDSLQDRFGNRTSDVIYGRVKRWRNQV